MGSCGHDKKAKSIFDFETIPHITLKRVESRLLYRGLFSQRKQQDHRAFSRPGSSKPVIRNGCLLLRERRNRYSVRERETGFVTSMRQRGITYLFETNLEHRGVS